MPVLPGTRAVGRLVLLLLLHLTMVSGGSACVQPAMSKVAPMAGMPAHQHHGNHDRGDKPAGSEGCTAPASCAPSMVAASGELRGMAPDRVELPSHAATAPMFRSAAPETPPPRV
jgi:hypothetical protein